MRKIFRWIKPYWWLFLIVILLQFLIPLTYSYIPQIIKYVFDNILSSSGAGNTLPKVVLNFLGQYEGVQAALVLAIMLVLYQIIRAGMMILNGFLKGVFSNKAAYDMRTQLFTHLQDVDVSYHSTHDVGDLIQRCTSDIDTYRTFIGQRFPALFYIVFAFGTGVAQMAAINVQIMWVSLIILPISVIGGIIFYHYTVKKFSEIEKEESKMTNVLEESINGVRVVKAFNREIYEIDSFNKRSDVFKKKSFNLNKAMAMYWGFSDGLTMLQYAVTIGFAIHLAQTGTVSTGDIVACILYISVIVNPIRNLGRIIGDFGKANIAAKRIDEILSVSDEYKTNGTQTPEVKGHIVFDDVHFRFSDAKEDVLRGLSFNIESGETVAIVGKTGSGKSTIASLLVRMHDYTSGSIKIDGVELKDIEKHYIRQKIGIILQNPFLYANTVYNNISIADPTLSKTDIENAASKAAIHTDIMNFDKGYNTIIGEKGVTLSGGQQQRLAIARMLVLERPVMIFDDSLSAVDTNTDSQIRKALADDSKLSTSIIITQRITTAKEADKIIVLNKGVVEAIGTHDELLISSPLYKSLWSIQGALEGEFIDLVSKEVKTWKNK
ncbi:MAG: ABC transporter ATP-binding protein [Bacilli bacterium]